MENATQSKPTKKTGRKLFFCILSIIVIIIIGVLLFIIKCASTKNTESEIITKSNLEKIINVSDLSTLEAVYNGIARVANAETPEQIDYYVSYNAKVKAGIDFQQVKIEVYAEEKVITVTLPEIKINDVNVDIASLDYIFLNDDVNTETVSAQAYEKCIEDVTNEVNGEEAVYELAEENAMNIIEALIKPFVSQLDAEYKLEIN